MRGLKQKIFLFTIKTGDVARSTRAWIETGSRCNAWLPVRSHALRVRGLKQLQRGGVTTPTDVARSTRAWIETRPWVPVVA